MNQKLIDNLETKTVFMAIKKDPKQYAELSSIIHLEIIKEHFKNYINNVLSTIN